MSVEYSDRLGGNPVQLAFSVPLPTLLVALAAVLPAVALVTEHLLPELNLIGLATRLSALGLLAMTVVIQIFVYPGAYPTHGVWAAALLYLVATGPGAVSIDHWLARRYALAPVR